MAQEDFGVGKGCYKVDYHLICSIYFSDEIISGTEIAQLWTTLRALGGRSVEMSFVCRGDTDISNLENSLLGSPALSKVLVARGDQMASVGAAVVRPDAGNAITDSDVNFGFVRDGIWDGEHAPATLDLSISGHVIEQVGTETILGVVKHFFDVADRCSPICGLVDLATPDDAAAGMVYGTTYPRNAPLHRWIEHMSWMYSGAKRRDCVRGLYWGNYFGPKILDRLGGHKVFLESCRVNARNYDGTPNAQYWDLPHGVFISLCLDPLDSRPGLPIGLHPAAEFNLRWLVRELGTKGVLNQW